MKWSCKIIVDQYHCKDCGYDNVIVIGGAVKTSNALAATREGFDGGINIK